MRMRAADMAFYSPFPHLSTHHLPESHHISERDFTRGSWLLALSFPAPPNKFPPSQSLAWYGGIHFLKQGGMRWGENYYSKVMFSESACSFFRSLLSTQAFFIQKNTALNPLFCTMDGLINLGLLWRK